MATKRLRKDLIKLRTEPPPGVIAEPDESNILKWYYAIKGPTETPYQGGVYLGKLVFPSEYPMKAPSVYMLTPSGRFQTSTKICMSMSDFHPESWNPLWSVATIIQGIQSFMASDELTTGGLKASEADRKKLAELSVTYNQRTYPDLFEGDIGAALEAADRLVKVKAPDKDETNAKDVVESSSSNGNKATASSRRSRRMAKMAAASNNNNEEEEEKKTKRADNDNDSTPAAEAKQELSPEEIEKRRKKNTKKRAKQKSKKSAAE